MKKRKSPKSLFASGEKPLITVEGSNKTLTKQELLQERAAMLLVIASMVKEAGGRVMVAKTTFEEVKSEPRVIRIIDGDVGFAIQFNDFEEREEPHNETIGETGNFLESDAAASAREYLAGLRRDESGNDNGGVPETE